MTLQQPIDFSRSRAILVGTSEYRPGSGLDSMPAAINSVNAMSELLRGPECGWPAERISQFVDRTAQDGVAGDVATLIGETTDVLLFYYVGHGQLLRGGDDLGMALTDTSSRVELRRATSLRLNDLREDLRYCRCRVKLLILDCCFSGIATRNAQGPGDLADRIERVAGSFTLTASRANQAAIYEDGKGGLTYFTKLLAEIVRDGVPGRPADLTLADIHQELERRFLVLTVPDGLERPEPARLSHDSADRFVFARNAAASAAPVTSVTAEPLAPRTASGSASPGTDDGLNGQLDRLRRRAWKVGGTAAVVGAVAGAEYAQHHADSGWSDADEGDVSAPYDSESDAGSFAEDTAPADDTSQADHGAADAGG